jgi:hypothetical protein
MSPTTTSRIALVLQCVTALAAVGGVFVALLPQRVSIVDVPPPAELVARRDSITREIDRLRDSARILARQETVLKRALSALSDSLRVAKPINERTDLWIVTILKTFVVFLVLGLAIVSTPFVLIGDLIALLFGSSFPLVRGLWSFAWDSVTVGWYWQRATPLGLILGMVLVLAGDGASVRRSGHGEDGDRR